MRQIANQNVKYQAIAKWLPILLLSLFIVACGGEQTGPEPAAQQPTEPVEIEAESETNEEAPAEEINEPVVVVEDTDTAEEVTTAVVMAGVDLSLFYEGALAEEVTTEACTLSGGTETICYRITIAGYPVNHDIGPFCPETTSTTAEDAGIWLDGNGVYELDGAFILGLAELYNDSNWKLYDDDGNVNITETAEAFDAAARPDVDPAYQNHCVEGKIEWLDGGEPVQTTVLIPTTPVMASGSTSPGAQLGITLNGVIIDNSAPVDAILSAYTIAAFDDCGGHINPVEGYHLHGAVGCSEVGEAAEGETPIMAYAYDGYGIHSPYDEGNEAADLDACNGHTTDELGYHYHAASVQDNAILSCFMGEVAESTERGGGGRGDGPPEGGQAQGGQDGPPGGGGRPDFAAAAEALGVTEEALLDALGGPPPDFAAAAATLGISEAALEEVLGPPPGR